MTGETVMTGLLVMTAETVMTGLLVMTGETVMTGLLVMTEGHSRSSEEEKLVISGKLRNEPCPLEN